MLRARQGAEAVKVKGDQGPSCREMQGRDHAAQGVDSV